MTFEVKLNFMKKLFFYHVNILLIISDIKQIRYRRKSGFLNKKTNYLTFNDIIK